MGFQLIGRNRIELACLSIGFNTDRRWDTSRMSMSTD
jgi:hypothetical protein